MDVNVPHVHVECTRVYVCTPVSKSLLHAVQVRGTQGLHTEWPHRDPSLYGRGISRHVQAGFPREEGSLTQQSTVTSWLHAPSPGRTPPPGVRAGGAVLTRDCRMAWLVAFMQESSGKEHSPSQ